MRTFWLALLALAALPSLSAQTLQPGDLALTAFFADPPDGFAVVALVDVAAGTEVYFTDNGWTAAGAFRNNEQTLVWRTPDALPAGTVVTFACGSSGPPVTPSAGTVSGDLCGLSNGGDQILVYQSDGATPRFLFALNSEESTWQADATSSNTSALPAGLADGATAVALPEWDNQVYAGPTRGTRADLLAALTTPANWTGADDRASVPDVPLSFTVTDGAAGPLVAFAEGAHTVSEANPGAFPVRLYLAPPAEEEVAVGIRVASGTATEGADFTFSPSTVVFAPGADTLAFTVTLLADEDDEGTETATFELFAPGAPARLGTPSTFTLTIEDDDATAPPASTIGAARAAGPGAAVTVRGVVTRALGDFVRIQDATAALTLRQTSGTLHDDVAAGRLAPGDSVEVTGVLSEFRGLLQINEAELTGYVPLGPARRVPAAQPVTLQQLADGGEAYESALVRVENLTTAATGVFNERQSYDVHDATGALVLRMPNAADTDLDGEAIPTGPFAFEGVVGQFSTTGTDGYQLLPVARTDVQGPASPLPTRVAFAGSAATTAEPAGTFALEVTLSNPSPTAATTVEVALTGGTATNGTDIGTFETTTLTFAPGSTARQHVTITLVDDGEDEGEETLVFTLQNPGGGQAAEVGAPGTFTLTLRDDGVAYATLFPGTTGAALLDSLRRSYTPRTLGYSEARRRLFGTIWNDGGEVEGIYSGARIPVSPSSSDPTGDAFAQNFNTEHAFPQSKGAADEPRRSDLHNLFPSLVGVNSDRGSLPFGEVDDARATDWYRRTTRQSAVPTDSIDAWSERGQGRFEPREAVKGEIARSQFYFYALYQASASSSYFNGMRDDLYRWHRLDPVSVQERLRHDRIEQQQGNANPFVLDSSLVRRAFFETTPSASTPPDAPEAFALERIYPNPTSAGATARLVVPEAGPVHVTVVDALGRVVLQTRLAVAHAGTVEVDVAAERLPAGVYVLRATLDRARAPMSASRVFVVAR